MNWRIIGLMVISTLAFAIGNTIIKFMDEYSEFQLVFFRSAGSLIITIVQLRLSKISPWGVNKPVLFLRGLSGVTALLMMFYLIKNIELGTAVTLHYMSPIFTAIIAVFLLKERVSMKQWSYLLLCVIGVSILKSESMGLSFQMLLVGLATAALSGLAYNCVRICRKTDHPLVAVFYFPLVGTPVSFLLISDWITPSWFDLGLIVILGVSTQIAQITMTKALQSDKAASVTILKYLGVVHAFGIGWLFFDEKMSWESMVGISVILLGIILFSKSKKP